MRVYSPFFSTLHDEAAAIGHLGRGTHYSILRAILWQPEAQFHDFAVIWDEDHDRRIIWIIEQLFVKRMLAPVLAIGERKGSITALTSKPQPESYASALLSVAESVPSDSFSAEVQHFPEADGMIINDEASRVHGYLGGIHALWSLGTKPCHFTTAPFGAPDP